MSEWGTTFGARLRWARELLGASGEEVAARVNALGGKATKSRVSEWERGTVPRPATQRMLARAVGQPDEWLMAGFGEPVVPDSRSVGELDLRAGLAGFSTSQLVDWRVRNDQLLVQLRRQQRQIDEVIQQRAGADPNASELMAQFELERELEAEAQRLEGQRAAADETNRTRRRRGRAS